MPGGMLWHGARDDSCEVSEHAILSRCSRRVPRQRQHQKACHVRCVQCSGRASGAGFVLGKYAGSGLEFVCMLF